VNSDVVGKLVNIASRCAGFITKTTGGRLAGNLADSELFATFAAAAEPIAAAYESLDYASAVRDIMALADRANQYIDQRKPWILAKQPQNAAEVQAVCTLGLNLFRTLMIYLAPVLPAMAAKTAHFFGESRWSWSNAGKPLLATAILPYEALATRLDPKAVAGLIDPAAAPDAVATAPNAQISIAEFARVDLRVARILAADLIPGADKLLKLRVDLGELGEREVFAGIRAAYDPTTLVGRLTVVVANLEPRRMRFGTSAGMVLAAGPGGKELFLLAPDSGAAPGMRVK
jgi:methionyl-tRNA synthetase